jgi:hypothetical protein
LWDKAGPEAVVEALTQISKMTNAALRVRNRAAFLLAEAEISLGKISEAESRLAALGFIEKWIVAGPFDNEGGTGLDTPGPAEKEEVLNPSSPMKGKLGEVLWRAMPEDASHFGYNHLASLHEPMTNTCFYARSTLKSDKGGPATLWIGADGAFRAF